MSFKQVNDLIKNSPAAQCSFQQEFDQSRRGQFYRSLNIEHKHNPFNNKLFYAYGPYETFGNLEVIHKYDGISIFFLKKYGDCTGNIQLFEFLSQNLILGVYVFMAYINQYQYTDDYDADNKLLWRLYLEDQFLEFGPDMDGVVFDSKEEIEIHRSLLAKVVALKKKDNELVKMRICFSSSGDGVATFRCNMQRSIDLFTIDPYKI